MIERLKAWGPLSKLGMSMAILAFVLDQAHKWWMLGPFDIASRGRVTITPFFDLVLGWNRGISYGLFAQDSVIGRYALVTMSVAISIGPVGLAGPHRSPLNGGCAWLGHRRRAGKCT